MMTRVYAEIGPAEQAAGAVWIHDVELDGTRLLEGMQCTVIDGEGFRWAARATGRAGRRWRLELAAAADGSPLYKGVAVIDGGQLDRLDQLNVGDRVAVHDGAGGYRNARVTGRVVGGWQLQSEHASGAHEGRLHVGDNVITDGSSGSWSVRSTG